MGKSTINGHFSIAMLVYQRIFWAFDLGIHGDLVGFNMVSLGFSREFKGN